VSAWVTTILGAVDHAIALAKSLGLPPPVADEIDKIKAAVNDRLDSVLPLAIVGVAVEAAKVGYEKVDQIESMTKSPHCPKCGAVCVQSIEKQVDGPGSVKLKCSSPTCTWSLP
jgi:formate dehydrogenase maturation protein FdhE